MNPFLCWIGGFLSAAWRVATLTVRRFLVWVRSFLQCRSSTATSLASGPEPISIWWETKIEHFPRRYIDGWFVMRRVVTEGGVPLEFIADENVYVTEGAATKAAHDMQDAWTLFIDEFGPSRRAFSA